MEIKLVAIEKPEPVNVILGQAHFIKTVEDLHEALVNAVPGIHFGLAFNEASQERLVRRSGTDDALVELAVKNALAVGAGHFFIVLLGEGVFPINVMHALRTVPEVVGLYAATANPLAVLVAEEGDQRAVLGVFDGQTPLGVEDEAAVQHRKGFLRTIGYKLG
jgi:adenosine/AMP kinase